MTTTTKSVVVKKFGDYNSLSVQEFPLPSLENRIEVEVHFCGMNFSDLYTRQGLFPRELPFVLGSECCGIITAMGSGVTDNFKIGQRVICFDYTGGMYSNIIRVLPNKCFTIPENMTYKDGASIFVNYLTAFFSVCEIGNLKSHQNILIKSCAGGVGWAATQFAKLYEGVTIYGTASPGKEELVKENGVDHVFTYEHLENRLRSICPEGFDLIIENQSGQYLNTSLDMLKPLGRIVLIGANSLISNQKKITYFSLLKSWWNTFGFSLTSLVMNNRIVAGLHLGTLIEKEPQKVKDALRHVIELKMEGKLKPRIDSVWPIEKIVDATKVLAERRNVGKVLISMQE